MSRLKLLSLTLLVLGVLLLGYSVAVGGSTVMWALIIPIIVGNDLFSIAGILCLMGGMLTGFLYLAQIPLEQALRAEPERLERSGAPTPEEPPIQKRYGGVVLLGPIPIVFGSDMKVAKWMLVVGLILVILLIALFLIIPVILLP